MTPRIHVKELFADYLSESEARKAHHGAAVLARELPENLPDGAHLRLVEGNGELFAVAVYDAARGVLQPRVMLAAGEK